MILFLLTACTRQETRLIEKEILEEAEETEKVEEAEKKLWKLIKRCTFTSFWHLCFRKQGK